MSRIGKKPITIPSSVTVQVAGASVSVKGPKGELKYQAHPDIKVVMAENEIRCEIAKPSQQASALWGTTRARLNSLVEGVTSGFKKELELQGVGYKAQVKGKDLQFSLGFSHPITVKAPDGIAFTVTKEIIAVEGPDKVLVGQVAADIRQLRVPEPYKGKGIRYVGEHVRRKVGKVVGATAE